MESDIRIRRPLSLQRQHIGLKLLKGDTDGAVVNINLVDVGYCDYCYYYLYN